MYLNSTNKLATLLIDTTLFTTVNGSPFAMVFDTAEDAVRWATTTKKQLKVCTQYRDAEGVQRVRWDDKLVGFDVFILGTKLEAKNIPGGFVKAIDPEAPKGAFAYVVKCVQNARNNKAKTCKECKGTCYDESGEACTKCLGLGFMFSQKRKTGSTSSIICPHCEGQMERNIHGVCWDCYEHLLEVSRGDYGADAQAAIEGKKPLDAYKALEQLDADMDRALEELNDSLAGISPLD